MFEGVYTCPAVSSVCVDVCDLCNVLSPLRLWCLTTQLKDTDKRKFQHDVLQLFRSLYTDSKFLRLSQIPAESSDRPVLDLRPSRFVGLRLPGSRDFLLSPFFPCQRKFSLNDLRIRWVPFSDRSFLVLSRRPFYDMTLSCLT